VAVTQQDEPRATDLHAEEAAIQQVREAIRAIDYGSVLIVIHDGEVVGIETSTKVRLKSSKR
jgi:hypothetical protein